MADPFSFELVSPERLLLSEQVAQVVVPGTEGEFTVLKNHAPFMSTIKPGVVTVTPVSGQPMRFYVRGGFADVNGSGLTILAEQAIPSSKAKETMLRSFDFSVVPGKSYRYRARLDFLAGMSNRHGERTGEWSQPTEAVTVP